VIDWIKLADDGSGDVIARLFEPLGSRARATLSPGPSLSAATVWETDLLEAEELADDLPYALPATGPVPAVGAHIDLGPFQVTTLRFRVAASKRIDR